MTLPQFSTSDYCDEYLNIVLADEIYRSGMLKEVLKHCSFSKRRPAVYLYLQDGEETNLSKLLHEDLCKVHVLGTQYAKVTMNQDIKRCSRLSHLSIVGRVRLDISLFEQLDKAVQSGNLPELFHLSLAGAIFANSQQNLRILSQWSFLRYLNLFDCEISDNDIQALSLLKTTSLVISGNTTLNLLSYVLENDTEASSGFGSLGIPMSSFDLAMHNLTGKGYLELIKVLGQRQLSHLTELNLSMARQESCCLTNLKPQFIPQLQILSLQRCITRLDDLKHLSEIVNSRGLQFLDISHSSGISRHLSVLMKRCFWVLHTLVLSDCGLHSDDLRSLAEARVYHGLPELRHLDISHNIDDLGCLFKFECIWDRLVFLNITIDFGLKDYIDYLEQYVGLGCLRSLQTLRFYVDTATRTFHCSSERGIIWPNLTTMEIVSTLNDVEHALTYARDTIKASCFPNLWEVCVVVKPNVTSDVKMNVLGDDWSDMFSVRHTPIKFQHQSESVPVREPDDKKFAEAMHELKSLGVEVHVWFSGDEQFTRKAGVM